MALRLPHAFTRALRLVAILLVVITLAGATYQGVATALERRHLPYPGRLVDVGDHQLHLYCTGTGSPVVVLEAPVTGMSAAWGNLQPLVANVTRVCSYDRAGLGWSEAGDRGYSPSRVPDELHALLMNASERAPYVMVGEGLGASFARMYASRYEHEVAALVIVDAPAGDPATRNSRLARLVRVSPWLARVGILRATRVLSRRAAGLAAEAAAPMRAFLNRPDHLTRSAEELERWDETVQLAAAGPLPAGVMVEDVTGAGSAPAHYLTDTTDARRVAAAIITTVRRVRASRPAATP